MRTRCMTQGSVPVYNGCDNAAGKTRQDSGYLLTKILSETNGLGPALATANKITCIFNISWIRRSNICSKTWCSGNRKKLLMIDDEMHASTRFCQRYKMTAVTRINANFFWFPKQQKWQIFNTINIRISQSYSQSCSCPLYATFNKIVAVITLKWSTD